ncbi:MAG TPA: DUF952 domain-containing protein [Sphingomonas sp.]|jgi:uncharacterized protein (DUF952 family)|uniref:DUF952 domain-containing protein n=1 Tax=Sphingomonas sp. TaxID=28214 RepID=UPI002EDA16F3
MGDAVYKVMTAEVATTFRETGHFAGAEIDIADGYIHFSTADQTAATLAKHFAGRDGLVLVTIDPDQLPEPLRWEPARGGQLFPHLYTGLPWTAVTAVDPLPLDADGRHQLPGAVSGTVV